MSKVYVVSEVCDFEGCDSHHEISPISVFDNWDEALACAKELTNLRDNGEYITHYNESDYYEFNVGFSIDEFEINKKPVLKKYFRREK